MVPIQAGTHGFRGSSEVSKEGRVVWHPGFLYFEQAHSTCARAKGGGFPVSPMVLVIEVGFALTLIAGILLACKLRQVGLTASALTATVNTVVEKIPLNQFKNIFQKVTCRESKRNPTPNPEPTPTLEPSAPPAAPHVEAPELSSIIRGVFTSERDARRYAKHLEWREPAQVPVRPHTTRRHQNGPEISAAVR